MDPLDAPMPIPVRWISKEEAEALYPSARELAGLPVLRVVNPDMTITLVNLSDED